MKKLGLILIAVALCVSLITSCAPENEIDEVVDMKFDVSKLETRTLNQSVEAFKSSELYWMYEAKKVDGTSYTLGQTEGKTVLGEGTSAKLTLSAGTWEFKLYGYKDAGHTKLAYEGETKATISGDKTTVAISVKTLTTTNGKGKLVVSNAVLNSVKDANVKLTISLILDNDAEHSKPWEKNAKGEYKDVSFDVKSGRHSGTIIVKTSDDKVVYSNEGIDFDIYDNLTTTIGGLLDGNTTEVEITTSIAEGVNKTESTTTVKKGEGFTVKATSAISVSGKGDTEVKFPADALSSENGNATITIITYDTVAVQKEESKPKFTIENENSVIGGLELLVKQNGEVISTFTNPVTVKTFIGKGLAEDDISIFYDKQDGTKEKVEIFEYDATEGILSFSTNHFSRYYVLLSSDYLSVGKSGEYHKGLLGLDEEVIFLPRDKEFDLGNKSCSIKGIVFPESDKEYTVTIKNGTINGVAYNAFTQYSNSHLILDNITIDWVSKDFNAVCYLYQGSNPAWLEVKNSALTNNVYGIGTNASKGTDYVYITIDNSKVTTTSSDQDNTAILFNVPGKLEIKNDSVISGERQGLIVRGGEATISNSTIISSGDRTDYTDYSNIDWGAGNEVPLAALVIGNRSNAYKYPTTVTLDNVTLSTPKEETERKLMYVYQNEGAPEVTVRGTLNGLYDAEAKENKRVFFNDATSIKSLGLFNLAANRTNTKGKTVTITLGDEFFSDIDYSDNNSGYTGKGLLIGNRSLNWYASSPVTNEKDKLTLVIEGGSVTSSSTGYESIDGLSNTSVYMLLPNGNTDVTFKNVIFNNVISFDIQKYSSPWSNLDSLTLDSCTFNGIIVGTVPSEKVKIDGCTFNEYINTTYANNSNPIWWRADLEGRDGNFVTIEQFEFTNNRVSSTRPIKIERVGRRDNSKKYTPVFKFLDNTFDISSQSSDTVTKNMAINIGQNDGDSYYHLYDDGNTISSNTASLYTAALGSGSNQWLAVPGTKIMDRNGNEKAIIARVWKTTTGETFEMKSIEK